MNTIEKREGDKITAEKRKDAKHKDEKQANYVETLEGFVGLDQKTSERIKLKYGKLSGPCQRTKTKC